ncbi:MFS transporter [Sandaracinobacteroides saxicola]|uniref:MFS transporter n=1 Tax=Sandaracinobacteroides saxicola TaxID=2759707 RepID=A0A7G5ILH4_9SPHN|nr:MFS transporter [Sandaracinobacteroides saxicola]QMW24216.1 MFS transporter [Sandaracinobacteroides saxicola]
MQPTADDRDPGPPRGFRFFLFASPQLALATLGLPIVIYLPAYYAGPLGLGLTATGLIFMITRFWDVLTDGVFGWATDRFPTRWGRRKVWMVVSAPLMALSAVAICFPPQGAGAGYLLFWLFFIYVWWTLIHLCHIAWAAELSDDYDQRSAIQGKVTTVYLAGLLLVLVAPIVAGAVAGETSLEQKVQAMGIYTAVLLPVTVLLSVLVARERPAPARTGTEPTWAEAMKLVLANPPLLRVLAVDLLAGLSNGIASGLFVYVTTQLFRLQGAMQLFGVPIDPGVLLLLTFVGSLVGVPLWLRLSYRVGKHRAVAASALLNIAAFALVLLVPEGRHGLLALFYLATGIAFGAPPFLDRAILADVVDLDRSRTGEQRTGLFFALMSMTNKIGYALPVGLLFPALALAGFNPNGANDAVALGWLAAMFVGLPILCNLGIVALMWRFPIDRAAQAALRARLQSAAV